MPRPLDPILGPDGRRLWVAARDPIGAEEINAACEWTRRVYKGMTREHGVDGSHNRGFQALGAIEFLMPRWKPGSVEPGRIYPESTLEGKTEGDHPGSIQIKDISVGTFEIFWDPSFYLFPSTQYFVKVVGSPHPIVDGLRRFRFLPSSRALNGFRLFADGNPVTFARQGHHRVPMLALIFGARR